MSEYKLTEVIIGLSEANEWASAKFEWDVVAVVKSDEAETCICGHHPIRNICIIKNSINRCSARIGRCCAKKFMKKEDSAVIRVVERIKQDKYKSPNCELIRLARKKKWITEWEWKFSMSTMDKRKLSDKQWGMRERINKKILSNMAQ